MHIHILGACGTFMAGIASIAHQLGHRVTGCDTNVYPPMSTLLQSLGIDLIEGFDSNQVYLKPDLFLIGNIVSRGNPLMEAILRQRLPYQSAPQWLYDHVLCKRHVIAVSGTHGKTTTTAMITHILHSNNDNCGFLIGGMASNFSTSASLGSSKYFVIEADEYDTAFFDKNPKFLHYHPQTLIINNIEFDHADIYPNIEAIIEQFHRLLRQLPDTACVLCPISDSINQLLDRGCYSLLQHIGKDWTISENGTINNHTDHLLRWSLIGAFNQHNALAAIGAAHHIGIPISDSLRALESFKNVKRRQELKGVSRGIAVYDDFAHHPTAITATLTAFREKLAASQRLIAVFDPASNSMKLGTHRATLSESFSTADAAFIYNNPKVGWNLRTLHWQENTAIIDCSSELLQKLTAFAQAGDTIVIMSNGKFDNLPTKLLTALSDMN